MMPTLDFTGPSLDESLVELPAYEQIRRRAARRGQIRRAGGLVAVVLAVALVTGAGVLFANRPVAVPASAVAATPWTFQQPATLIAQLDSSYSLLKTDSGPVLARAGDSEWQGWRIPPLTKVFPDAYDRYPCDTDRLTCAAQAAAAEAAGMLSPIVLGRDTVEVGFLITHDGGRSWLPRQLAYGAPVDQVPAGWVLLSDAKEYAIDPANGQRHELAHQALATSAPDVVTPAKDGSYWLANGSQVAVSHDRGHSWDITSFPWRTTTYVASYDGRTGYALTRHKVSRTSDGGRTWSEPLPAAIDNPGALEVAPSGRLLTFDIRAGGSVAMASKDGQTYDFTFGNDVLKVDGLERTSTDGFAYRLAGAYAGRIVTLFDDRFGMSSVPPNVTVGR